MATFSPSPAPRRTRLQTRTGSPSRRNLFPRQAQTPSQFGNDTASVFSAMDVDERTSIITERSSRATSDLVFSKTEEMSVSYYATLPLEVKQVLRTSDFVKDQYSGEIDTDTGFALITSARTCFVWQHVQAIKGIPTCYIFSCPEDTRALRTPFHAIVPQGTQEPGLILVSHTGQIRFWESIGNGLAGGENYATSQLDDLEYDEQVTHLVRADPQTYIISTTYGGLYRLSLTSAGGKYHLTGRQFARPASRSLSRLLPSFLSSATPTTYEKDPHRHVHAVSLSSPLQSGERNVFVLANGVVQTWSLKPEGWEDLLHSGDIFDIIATSVQSTFRVRTDDLELSDIAVSDKQMLYVLVSYSPEELLQGFRRLYALVELSFDEAEYTVKSIRSVPYQTTSQPGPPVHPRIQLLFSASIISVQFGDAVALCASAGGYRDRLELKSVSDRTLGVGVSSNSSQLLVLTATTMVKVILDLEKIEAFSPITGQADLIKSVMMQAILYGSLPSNPLRFSFPPDLNAEALMQGAEKLSAAVVRSDPEVIKPSLDLTAQMTNRKERLSWLIGFINENGVLTKMSQQCRQILATDAEKLYSAYQLWLLYNKSLPDSQRGILREVIQKCMQESEDTGHEDLIRAFFRLHVNDLWKIPKLVNDLVRQQLQSAGATGSALVEANKIVITVLNSAFHYREYNKRVYGVGDLMIKSWTSKPSVIDAILGLFDLTTSYLESGDSTIRATDSEPSSQLPHLASLFLQTMKERLEWMENSGRDNQNDAVLIQQRLAKTRPEILETLRQYGHVSVAYELAEHYQDFASLVALCNSNPKEIFPPNVNPNAERIQSYIFKFKEEFATELLQWYIQHGEVRTLFEQEDRLGAYIDNFFRQRPNPSLSWLHELYRQDFASAAASLLDTAEHTQHLETKHVMLSIGKLACLAQSQESNTDVDERMLDAFHDDLDLVSVHQGLVDAFKSVLAAHRGRQSLETQVDTIIRAKAPRCEEHRGFAHIFKDLSRHLLQGRAIPVEDLVDLLTLKDNSSSLDDFAISLHLLTNTEAIPEARKESALRTVWRRTYLHDDWESIQRTADVSDDELTDKYRNTALFATLVAALQRDERIITPDAALMIPSTEEIASRWPGLSNEQVDVLSEDYASEQDRLGELSLEDAFNRIHELAKQAVEEADEEDD